MESMEWAESGRTATGIAFDFPAGDPSTPMSSVSPAARVPRRISRRLMETRNGPPPTAEEIEAKLREADLRRQQFHEWLSRKARPKPRSPSWSSQEDDLGQRLEAKLYAAEQKRLTLLAKAQKRLARLDELRQAAKSGAELRFRKEREKLGTKVESRVQQAEANRMLLLQANIRRRAVAQERTAQSLLQRMNREKKYKDCIRTAISQKRAAAERKRLRLLEEEKTRAHTRVMQARQVSQSVCHQREIERQRMKEQLEDRLLRAKRQRAEYLRQRGSPSSSARVNWSKMQKHGEILSRKLTRCWRWFVTSKGTTFSLAKAFDALDINEKMVKSMPFEHLAVRIESSKALQTVKALLDRLELRFMFSQSSNRSSPENIDHLLKRLGSPNKRGSSAKSRTKGQTRRGLREYKVRESQKLSRYSVRVVLCAYMILGHPDAVFSGQGERENELADSAANFIREFELLIKVIRNGPCKSSLTTLPSQETTGNDMGSEEFSTKHTLRSQLAVFDAAWRSYLYCFVAWKVKDARSLEDDLVRAACQLELSMMQTCKVTFEGQESKLTHDMKAIQKQVTEDQQMLRDKVRHLSGNAGIERMESALSDTRSRFFEAKENGSHFATPVAHVASPLLPSSSSPSISPPEDRASVEDGRRSSSVARALFVDDPLSQPSGLITSLAKDASSIAERPSALENELLVNEIVHEHHRVLSDSFDVNDGHNNDVKAKIKTAMEKAFWNGILESLEKDPPDYGRIVELVSEVRDELCKMAPQIWKQEICDSIDLDILTQVLASGSPDLEYLGNILEYALSMLRKLSAPANEDQMKNTHQTLLTELTRIAQSSHQPKHSFVVAVVKGLQFVLEQIEVLKKEISKARIQMMVPIIKGPAGLEYLQKAFGNRYGPPINAVNSLPLTAQWISSLMNVLEEWEEHADGAAAFSTNPGLPLASTLRSGGSVPVKSNDSLQVSTQSLRAITEAQPECKGERLDILLRLGVLKLVSGMEGLAGDKLPETLKLNFSRLRTVQANFQNVIVISTSMLVLRQILYSDSTVAGTVDVESVLSISVEGLCEMLKRSSDVGIAEIIDVITGSLPGGKLEEKREVMARVLVKSLQAGDAVFEKVSRSVYLAARAIVLGGSGNGGRQLADAAIRRVGASVLLDQLVDAGEKMIVLASVSGRVHKPWYDYLLLGRN